MQKIIRKLKKFRQKNNSRQASYQAFYSAPGKALWSGRNYSKFCDEGFIRNVVAHRAVNLIAGGAASVKWKVSGKGAAQLYQLLNYPNPANGGAEFFEALYSYKLINGNAYIQAIKNNKGVAGELYLLRPDRVSVIAGKTAVPSGYRYNVDGRVTDFKVDILTGQSDVLHLKNFNPLDDWYGLSAIEAAAYAIDQHNEAGQWNQALLQNGARPSGALMVKGENAYLSEEQYRRIKEQVEDSHTGAGNAGKPLLLEGGLEWHEMSLNPKDMDFLTVKNSSARDIALAFGVPAQLLGIPGDSTYNNMAEARLVLWEQTIIPLLENTTAALNNWLAPMFGADTEIMFDKNSISALIPRREALWKSLQEVDFLTVEEKRGMVGV